MFAHAWISAVVVVLVPTREPRDSHDEALALYDDGAYLEAAAVAIGGYVSPSESLAKRLQNARLAQEALAKAYESTAASEPRPAYLCRALDVLDATAPLAVDPEERSRHTSLIAERRATLVAGHPDFQCERGTELRPILAIPRPPVEVRGESVGEVAVDGVDVRTNPVRENRAPTAMKITGAVSMTIGVAALAVMVGGLVVKAKATRAGDALNAAQRQQEGELSIPQAFDLAAATAAAHAGRQVALATGISGLVLLGAGAALVGRGHVLARRARVSVMASPSRVGFFIEGSF